jgi:hypothetical protein
MTTPGLHNLTQNPYCFVNIPTHNFRLFHFSPMTVYKQRLHPKPTNSEKISPSGVKFCYDITVWDPLSGKCGTKAFWILDHFLINSATENMYQHSIYQKKKNAWSWTVSASIITFISRTVLIFLKIYCKVDCFMHLSFCFCKISCILYTPFKEKLHNIKLTFRKSQIPQQWRK